MSQTFTETVAEWLRPKGYTVEGNALQPTKFNGPVYKFSLTEKTDDYLTFKDPFGGSLKLTIGQYGKRLCLIITHNLVFVTDEHQFPLSDQ